MSSISGFQHANLKACIFFSAKHSQEIKSLILLNNFILEVALFQGVVASTGKCYIVCFCSGVAVCMTSPLFSCPSLSGVLPHLLFLQNLPSVVAGHVLDPQPSEMILDMCAAPGEMLFQS